MHMKNYEDLKDKLCEELEEIARKEDMSAGDLEAVHKLTDTIKNIDKILMFEEYEGYSERADGYGRSYNEGGSSYANRRGTHYVRGHYSRADGRSMRGGRGRGYSRDDAKEYIADHIESLMDSTDNERVRKALEKCLDTVENA